MNLQEFYDKYSPFIRRNLLPISLGLVGLMFLVYGVIVLIGSSDSSKDIVLESQDDTSSASSQKELIFVDVEGAVAKPGVYSLPQSSRVRDGLIAAGGLSGEADRAWVSKTLNLASKLTDGAKIYIPRTGEAGITRSASSGQAGITGSSGSVGSDVMGASSQININSASESELDTLPGIGPVTAQKIISNRPYQAIEELLSKKVVSQKVFDNIKGKITL